ncbi:MAG: TnpV protein [Defluviitaleaceae bacterium]|nr:TnpV protein [Defluviitaleaceae bacterium]
MKKHNGDNIIFLNHNHQQGKNAHGKYAELHQAFLQSHHPKLYDSLLALGKLDEWLFVIDEIATRRFELGKSVGYSQAEIENTLFTEVIYNLR